MNLAKYRNRRVTYQSPDFTRIDATVSDLEELADPQLTEVHIYHPSQSQINKIPTLISRNISSINIWGGDYFECSAFEELKHISYLSIHDNNKLKTLWDFEKTKQLKGLGLIGCTKIASIDFLEKSIQLLEFHLAGNIWKKQSVQSLKTVAKLKNLTFLSLSQLKIEDEDHSFLIALDNLKELVLSANIFTTEQFAELSAKLTATQCRCFKGYIEDKEYWVEPNDCKTNRVQIVGFRKPSLDSETQAKQIDKYIIAFNEMKSGYS